MMTSNAPGWSAPLPDPTETDGSTRWAAPADYPRSDVLSSWADADPPAAAPPVVQPVTERVGWLMAGRVTDRPDRAG